MWKGTSLPMELAFIISLEMRVFGHPLQRKNPTVIWLGMVPLFAVRGAQTTERGKNKGLIVPVAVPLS